MPGQQTSQSWKTQDTHQVQGPEQWMQDEGANLYNSAKANSGYQAYTGERVADYDENWDKSADLVKSLAAPSQDLSSARSFLQELIGASGNDPNKSVSDYINPYVAGVLEPTLRNLDEARQRTGMSNGFAATMSGAFGDAQHGVANALTNRDYLNSVSDVTNKTYADAFDKGLAQQNTVLSRLMAIPGMFQSIGAQDDQRTATAATALNALSGQKREIAQAKDNVGFSDFVTARDWNANKAKELMALLNDTPHDTITDAHTTSYGKETKDDNSGLQALGSLLTKGLSGLLGGGGGAGLVSGLAGALI